MTIEENVIGFRASPDSKRISIGSLVDAPPQRTRLQVRFNENATHEAVRELLSILVYEYSSELPEGGERMVQMVITDGRGGTSATVTREIEFEEAEQDADPALDLARHRLREFELRPAALRQARMATRVTSQPSTLPPRTSHRADRQPR